MSRGRFASALALLALVVAAASFGIALSVLDDGEADPPPALEDTGDTLGGQTGDATSTTPPPAAARWVVVIASEEDEARAAAFAADVAAAGHPADVLRSDDHASLNPGFWVAFAGPYADRATAEGAVGALEADGFSGTYVRCAGSEEACGDGGD